MRRNDSEILGGSTGTFRRDFQVLQTGLRSLGTKQAHVDSRKPCSKSKSIAGGFLRSALAQATPVLSKLFDACRNEHGSEPPT